MRFNRDKSEVEKQILSAIEQGVNYFDTAYLYPGSEALLGEILAKHQLHSQVKIATKLPLIQVRKPEDFDKYFNTQLERLQTATIDYYLLHMLTDFKSWERLCELGIKEWIAAKRAEGEICNIGFSFHGAQSEFIQIIDAYDWDICMIQYNYLDEHYQAGKVGLEYAASKGIGVIVMEPLRGGTLVKKLPQEAVDLWKNAPVRRTYADWGFRWVLNHPQVISVLSGMSTLQMVQENITTVDTSLPHSLTDEELAIYDNVRTAIRAATLVPCTGCGYCMPCPQGVNIPACFASLNDTKLMGRIMSQYWYIVASAEQSAALCVHCGACERHCPQEIPISEDMLQVKKVLEGFPYKPMKYVIQKVLKRA